MTIADLPLMRWRAGKLACFEPFCDLAFQPPSGAGALKGCAEGVTLAPETFGCCQLTQKGNIGGIFLLLIFVFLRQNSTCC